MLSWYQTVSIHQLEPCCLRPCDGLEFLQRGLDHGGVILAPRDGCRQLVEDRQPAGAHAGIIENDQQEARAEKHFREQIRFTWNVAGKERPVQIQREQPGAKQECTRTDPAGAVAHEFDDSQGSQKPTRHIHSHSERFRIDGIERVRKIHRPHGCKDRQHPPDGGQHGQLPPRLSRHQCRCGKQPDRQNKVGLGESRHRLREDGQLHSSSCSPAYPEKRTVRDPARAPHQQTFFAKGPKEKQTQGNSNQRGSFPRRQPGDGHQANPIPKQPGRTHKETRGANRRTNTQSFTYHAHHPYLPDFGLQLVTFGMCSRRLK
jgi:hypothetical protein